MNGSGDGATHRDIPHNLVAEFTGDSLVVISPDKRVVYANQAAKNLLGFDDETDLLSAHCCDVLSMDICRWDCPAEKIADPTDVINSYFVRRKDSHKVFCVTTSLILNSSGGSLGHIHSIKNMQMVNQLIEEQGRTQDKLRRSRLQMQAILESIADGIFTVEQTGKIVHFSRSMERITGFAEEEVLGKRFDKVLRGSIGGPDCPVSWSIKEGQRTEKNLEYIQNRAERSIPVRVATSLIREEGKVTGVVCAVHDRTEIENLRKELLERMPFSEIVGTSKPMNELFSLIDSVCKTDVTVLVEGETGTGKELVARAIHQRSSRENGPFVTVNCSVLSPFLLESELFGHSKGAFTGAVRDRKGKFEAAHKGTLFLDEISEITPETQIKLLRFLQTKEFERVGETAPRKVDARIIVATNRPLKEMTRKGTFRKDLFYRLNVVPITVPPLRSRKEDLPLLVSHFIEKHKHLNQGVDSIATQALSRLIEHSWPGNVRELENAVIYAMASCPRHRIEKGHLPPDVKQVHRERRAPAETAAPGRVDPAEIEKNRILKTLEENNWRVGKAANALGYHRITLWRRIKSLGIVLPNRRS